MLFLSFFLSPPNRSYMPEMKLKNQNLLHNFKCSVKSLETKLGIMKKLEQCAQKANLNLSFTVSDLIKNNDEYLNIKEHLKKVFIDLILSDFEKINLFVVFKSIKMKFTSTKEKLTFSPTSSTRRRTSNSWCKTLLLRTSGARRRTPMRAPHKAFTMNSCLRKRIFDTSMSRRNSRRAASLTSRSTQSYAPRRRRSSSIKR